MSQDPIGFRGADTSLFRYCGNDPINKTDPNGEVVPILIGIGIGIGLLIPPMLGCQPPPPVENVGKAINPFQPAVDVAEIGEKIAEMKDAIIENTKQLKAMGEGNMEAFWKAHQAQQDAAKELEKKQMGIKAPH
jgi:hypothetical protein